MLRFVAPLLLLVALPARAEIAIQTVTSPGGITAGWSRNRGSP
jgi:hypothetical protein